MQIICKNVSLGYDSHVVSENIDFAVAPGDYLCIVGENGAGKSTLMKALLGLHPLLSGKIEFSDGLKQNEIGYLPQQNSFQRDFPASVQEVVISGCLNRCGLRPFYRRAEQETARTNMEKLGIWPLRERCYRELSGGQQQRVLLARALCATRKLLLLDEPVSGLDPSATAEMYAIIRRLNKEEGITVLMIFTTFLPPHGKRIIYCTLRAGRCFLAARRIIARATWARPFFAWKRGSGHEHL